jgi:hypothetical protein
LYFTVGQQDVSTSVVISRANSISSLLVDISQVTERALGFCAAALVETIVDNPEVAGMSDTATLCMSALSSVLEKSSVISTALLNNVTKAMSLLTDGIQSHMAVGEAPQLLFTKNVRGTSFVTFPSDLVNQSLTPPVTGSELLRGISVPSISFRSSNLTGSSVGVVVVQYYSNPSGIATDSLSIGLRLTSFEDTNLRRRLRADHTVGITAREMEQLSYRSNLVDAPVSSFAKSGGNSKDSSVPVSVTVQNVNPVVYSQNASYNGTLFCSGSPKAFNRTVLCFGSGYFVLVCNETVDHFMDYICPAVEVQPACMRFDGSTFKKDPACKVVSYSSGSSSCECKARPNSAGAGGIEEFAASAEILASAFVSVLKVTKTLTPAAVLKNIVVLIVVSVLVLSTGIGLVFFVRADAFDMERKSEKNTLHIETFTRMLRNITPLEFRALHWTTRLWKKMLVEHDWFCILSPYNEESDYRSIKWVHAMGFLMITLFIDTILAVFTFNDNGVCEAFATESACLLPRNLDQIDTLCVWDSSTSLCAYNSNPSNGVLALLIQSSITTTITIPFMVIFTFFTRQIKVFFSFFHHSQDVNSGITEIQSLQSLQGTLLRAARLSILQKSDDMSIEEESSLLLSAFTGETCDGVKNHDKPDSIMRVIEQSIRREQVSHLLWTPGRSARNEVFIKISESRVKADHIEENLKCLTTDAAKSQYL